MHLRAWRKRDRECRREMRVTVGAPELMVEGSARRLPAGLAGPDPRPKAASGQRLASYGPVDDGAACETLVQYRATLVSSCTSLPVGYIVV